MEAATTGSTSTEDQLTTLLASPQFSVASYFNVALSTSTERGEEKENSNNANEDDLLQTRMAELALQLQLQTQSCHEAIGKIGAELQAIVPRCAADVGRVGVGLDGIRLDAQTLWNETTSTMTTSESAPTNQDGEPETPQGATATTTTASSNQNNNSRMSLETLGTLHALQSNLSKAKEVLTAAATWDTTLASIPPLLAQTALSSSSLPKAVEALVQLEQGERALRGMPQQLQERQQAVEGIRNQVQLLLQPQLQAALQQSNGSGGADGGPSSSPTATSSSSSTSRLGPLQQSVHLYAQLNQMDVLKEEYVKARPKEIHRAWFAFAPTYGQQQQQQQPGGGEDSTIEDSHASTSETTTSPAAEDSPFVKWLPTWYELVLTLLTEERRQLTLVFGPEATPELMAKVLKECFRPLLPSFKSRLETLSSSSGAATAVTKNGSLESICLAYEATLRFLSLSYELVTGAFLDVMEAGTGNNSSSNLNKGGGDSSGVGLYQEMVHIFAKISSPFSAYQTGLDVLELNHLQVTASVVSKDMHQAVGDVITSSVDSLQQATERLKNLAPFIFPMTEGSLDRFELMNGGYRVRSALGTVDKLLMDHVGELVIAIGTLSTSMTADGGAIAEAFDEQHVLCAMEVLKVAGEFRSDLNGFGGKTRKRLSMLSDRMAASFNRDNEVHVAMEQAASKSVSFSIPDALSVVEVDSIVTKLFCATEEDHQSITSDGSSSQPSLARLRGLATSETSLLFPQAEEAAERLVQSCHAFVLDICASVPRQHLAGMSDMSQWKAATSASDLDSYGTLPQQYITLVGEHMLALVQALEPFAADPKTLAVANEVMDGVREAAVQPWTEFLGASGAFGNESAAQNLMNGKGIERLVLNNAALTEEDAELEQGAGEDERKSAKFCNQWLDVIGLSITGRLLERIMCIPQITQKGCDHLAADLNYLVNVFSALGVAGHPHPLVSHLAALAALKSEELVEHIATRNPADPLAAAMRSIEVRMALLRGVSI